MNARNLIELLILMHTIDSPFLFGLTLVVLLMMAGFGLVEWFAKARERHAERRRREFEAACCAAAAVATVFMAIRIGLRLR